MAPITTTKTVPAAFHLEISEYASLLRTIRTNSTLDLVPQLSRPQFVHADVDDDKVEIDDDDDDDKVEIDDDDDDKVEIDDDDDDDKVEIDDDDDGSGGNGGSQGRADELVDELEDSPDPSPSSKGKGKATQASQADRRKRVKGDGTWTRWPLLREHCAVPEWGLDEEVKAIVEHSLRTHASDHGAPPSPGHARRTGGSSAEELDDGDDQPALSPAHLSGLTSDVSSKLSSLLSLLALHRTNVTFTKHNRVDPMKWEDVLEVAGVAKLFDRSVVEDAMRRMEEVFGPSGSEVLHHMQVLEASEHALQAAHATFGEDVSSLVGPPRAKKSRRRKRKRGADKSASEDDAEVNTAEQLPASHNAPAAQSSAAIEESK